jgi:hypothetical protein
MQDSGCELPRTSLLLLPPFCHAAPDVFNIMLEESSDQACTRPRYVIVTGQFHRKTA